MSKLHVYYASMLREMVVRLSLRAPGQGMVEYALILAFVAILVIVALKFLQPSISGTLNRVSTSL